MTTNLRRTLGATTALVLGLVMLFAATAGASSDLCPALDSGKIDVIGDPATVEFEAPDGYLITGYCVKAGTEAVFVTVDPPAASVTIDHPDKDSISHYSVSYSVTTTTQPEETTTTLPEETTTTQPEQTTTTIAETTTTTGTTTTEPPPPSIVPPTTIPPASGSVKGVCVDGEAQIKVEAGAGDYQLTIDTAGVRVLVAEVTGPVSSRVNADADEGDWVVARLYSAVLDDTELLDAFGFRVDCLQSVPTTGAPTTPTGEGVLPFTGGIDPKLAALGIVLALGGLVALGVSGRIEQ